MGEFAAGSRIESDRKVYQENGSPDPLGRWIDQEGYVRLENGDLEDGWRVDDDGRLSDGSGIQQDNSLEVPPGWQAVPAWLPMVQPGDTLWTTEGGQPVTLSTTAERHPSADALKAFQKGIKHTSPRDAQNSDLTWAGEDFDPDATMHGRALGAEYVGEDRYSNAFRAGTVRAARPGNDTSWTTFYGVSDDATRHKSVQERNLQNGLLVDSSGQPLHGTFGYVVDPHGKLYTFNRNEAFVTINGQWKDVTDSPQLAGILLATVQSGEQARQVYHSTAVSGQPVAGAGDIQVDKGKIIKISNDSGHYQPEAEYLWQTMQWLAAQGMPVWDINVRTVATTRDAEKVLKAWKFQLSRGNVAQVAAKDGFRQKFREKAIMQLPPDDPTRTHFEEAGCLALEVARDGNKLYCTGCDTDLDEKYRPLLPPPEDDDPGGI